jgi:site-specific DNA-methyltransferase (adenine-specific)
MSELKDESVHLVITSPPYWQLKDYGNGSHIGLSDIKIRLTKTHTRRQ